MRATLTITILAVVFTFCLQAQEAAKNSNMTTLQGCLQYTKQHYVLTDSSGTEHQLSGNINKFKPHIGHQVEVTGTEGVHTTGTTQQGAKSTAQMSPVFKVSAIKHIADSCSAGSH